ncbi:nickel pincer cofactor biosynthesis protein LarC [Bacteroidota bacterium]
MKIIYFDCFSGASGNMILGALIDTGLNVELLKEELKKLNLGGYEFITSKKVNKGISGTHLQIKVSSGNTHRGLKDIFKIIDDADLKEVVKNKSKKIFSRLAEVEARIHNKTVDEIHFHEVGAVDSIVDIVGTVIALDLLGIEKVTSSKIHVGTGTLKCAHGTLPVPAPATLELLRGVPVYSTGIESEMVTPTGAAIITTLSDGYGNIPEMKILETGFGMGDKDLGISNFLRVVIGEESIELSQGKIQMIETNIDDMNPEFYEHVMERLFENGAKDVFLTQVIMKKNRPGIVLSVMSEPQDLDILTEIIFQETSTLGVRISDVKKRMVASREIIKVETSWGEVGVKVKILGDGEKSFAPEYEDCRRIANDFNIPVSKVYDIVTRTAQNSSLNK